MISQAMDNEVSEHKVLAVIISLSQVTRPVAARHLQIEAVLNRLLRLCRATSRNDHARLGGRPESRIPRSARRAESPWAAP